MSEELFEIPLSESPRLKWLRDHNVKTLLTEFLDDDENQHWSAWNQEDAPNPDNTGIGETEHDAIVALALMNGWKLWNEL